MREIFVTELVRELMGPRNGLHEVMDNPLSEYICGVLQPVGSVTGPDIDSASQTPVNEAMEGEDDRDDTDIPPPRLPAPALNPQDRPYSMGMSFIVEATDGPPAIQICITWARYARGDGQWSRTPCYYVSPGFRADESHTFWVDGRGQQVSSDRAEISLHIVHRDIQHNRHLVSVYLVNRISPPQRNQPLTTEHHIFQPQIRVVCEANSMIVPGLERFPDNEEERDLSFLYRSRPVLARGHLCSVVWREIDPESDPGNIEFTLPEARDLPPFHWPDGEILPDDVRQRFSPPDCRTEFVPLYSVLSPLLDWPSHYGRTPEFHAEILSETWDTVNLRAALEPLVEGYSRWISELRQEQQQLHPDQELIASRLIDRCVEVARRLRTGLEILLHNEDARLSFCFANKAMEVQSRWASASPLTWRPFQLAFILMVLESIVNSDSIDRHICDLLWVPTGTGKTEAYLAISALTMAFRRRLVSHHRSGDSAGGGISIISRYTLRLLTIQQFRRALRMVTACELLRIEGLSANNAIGWRPSGYPHHSNFMWGVSRFSIGLWVGGGVTPNRLRDTWANQRVPGALSILKGQHGEGEPAQVLNCPGCNTLLSVPTAPRTGLQVGRHCLHLVIRSRENLQILQGIISPPGALTSGLITVDAASISEQRQRGYFTLSVEFSLSQGISASHIDSWWSDISRTLFRDAVDLVCVRASQCGYFVRWYSGQRGQREEFDFDIFCPNPVCPLRVSWCEGTPAGSIFGDVANALGPTGISGFVLPGGARLTSVNHAFRTEWPYISDRVPIPGYTVDDQIYHRCPSIVIATVDKFARPPFEAKASALFGNVDHHHAIWGFYRQYQPPFTGRPDVNGHPSPAGTASNRNYVSVDPMGPPDLIIQDELHLIEGPLGSLTGFYETAADELSVGPRGRIKYIASTATVRRAQEQVAAVFNRGLVTFPPPGLLADERFFIRQSESHSLDDAPPGRLYVGICVPGRGPLTPIVRIWSRLLQTAWQNRPRPEIDPYWTLTGYFNAIRELGGARALYRQDIPERVNMISGANARPLPDDRCQELSSRTNSTELPAILDSLNCQHPEAQDGLFTTSMFGTGIDIPRIGLMVVHGQPKTTSAYIQSTGRVGRSRGALVVTFLRATRPRDLNHYEFFCGYHSQLHRFVEAITVMPFSTGVLDRALGPVAVFLLRNMAGTTSAWHRDISAGQMASQRTRAPEVQNIPRILERRGQDQPSIRRPPPGSVRQLNDSKLDRWQHIASAWGQNLRYVEYAVASPPSSPVVLGDPAHQYSRLDVVYENAPQSLRDIEETAGFET